MPNRNLLSLTNSHLSDCREYPTGMSRADARTAQYNVRQFGDVWEVQYEEDYQGEACLILLVAANLDAPSFLLHRASGFVHLTSCRDDTSTFEGAFITVQQAIAAAARLSFFA